MIKLQGRLNQEEESFEMEHLEHENSCNAECLSVICSLIDQMEKFGKVNRKQIFKMLKEFDGMWVKQEKAYEEEEINAD